MIREPTASVSEPAEKRLLVLAPTARDAALTRIVLAEVGIACTLCADLAELVREHGEGCGAILVAEEALDDGLSELSRALSVQPAWSDVPVLVLTRHGADSPASAHAAESLGNVTLVERPIQLTALVSAVRTALRARARQFEIRAHVVERERAAEALREADRRKDEFLATLAHELRNPLAPIRIGLDVLRMSSIHDPVFLELRPMLARQVDHMVRLVDDLLELSRITRGVIELRKESVDLASIVHTAVDASRPILDEAGHRLTVRLPTEPVVFQADPVRLAQVFANLLNNAGKYTEAGGRIRLSARQKGRQLLVSVRDNGIGIPESMRPRVFDMFTQVEPSRGRTRGGLGIGLTLVRSLVELHGGTVCVHSLGEGRGSRFVVRLPAIEPSTNVESAPRETSPDACLANCRVLVVDDNRDAAESLSLLLARLGADVRVVHDGPAAIETLARWHPSAVLLDVGMPGMSGLEVARRIRARPALNDLTLIALTGWGQEEDRRRTREAGFDHHLVKPADVDVLRALLV